MIEALLLLGGLALAISASGFFSGTETGVYCLNRVRLRLRAAQGDPAAVRLERITRRPDRLVISALVGTNVADYATAVLLAALVLRSGVSETWAEFYTTAIGTPLVLVFGGIVPKDLFQRRGDTLMYPVSGALAACHALVGALGLSWLLGGLARGLTAWIDPTRSDADEALLPRARVQRLLHEGAAHGGLSSFQRETIERVMHLGQVRLGSVMVPRGRAALVPEDISRDDFLRIARMAHFSRYPVYRGDPRQVIGVVEVFDVITDEQRRPVAAHVRPPLTLRADQRVPAALRSLQREHRAMAIIVDRRGQCVGLLTMKDLVEEIVGDLAAW